MNPICGLEVTLAGRTFICNKPANHPGATINDPFNGKRYAAAHNFVRKENLMGKQYQDGSEDQPLPGLEVRKQGYRIRDVEEPDGQSDTDQAVRGVQNGGERPSWPPKTEGDWRPERLETK